METKLAKIISVLFQPLLIPTYTLLILFSFQGYMSLLVPPQAQYLLVWIVFLSTFVFPLIFILILYKRGMIKTLDMDQKEERILPLVITLILYFLMYYVVWQARLDVIIHLFFLGSALLIVLALAISFFWKISMHMIGVGGMMGALTGINLATHVNVTVFVVFSVIISGLVGFARLKLQAHTPAQVYAGFFAGFMIMLALFLQ